MEQTNAYNISKWNQELASPLLPNNIVLAIYLFLGVTGNVFVIFVYTFRMKKQSEDRYFIPVLSVFDLLSCVFSSSMGITFNLNLAEFTNDGLCKALWVIATFVTYTSVLLLATISIHRYLKVCKPIEKQMSLGPKRVAVCLSVIIAIMFAAPTSILYGSVEISGRNGTLVGRRCGKIKDGNKVGSLIYSGAIGLLALTSVLTVVILYTKIGLKIFFHVRKMQQSGHPIPDDRTTKHRENDRPAASFKKGEYKNKAMMHKFTIMFMIITIVFLISFIPRVVLMAIESRNPKFWEDMSDGKRSALLFFYRVFILNSLANPYIYAFLDVKFRNEAMSMLRRKSSSE